MKVRASYHQERLWFIDNFERNTLYSNGASYHYIPLILRCDFHLNYDLVRRAVNQLVRDHEILRTEITEEDGGIYQIIDESEPYFDFEVLEGDNEKDVVAYLLEVNENLYADGLKAPFMKVYIIKVSENEYDILFSLHHLVCDSYSKKLIRDQFIKNYKILETGQNPELNIGLQYADFSEWQRNLAANIKEDQEIYWRRKAGHPLQALELPIDHARKLIHEYKADQIIGRIDAKLFEELGSVAKKLNCSKEKVCLAVFKLLMTRMSGLEEINIGTSLINRKDDELKNTVGPIANLVLLSDDYNLECDFCGFLDKTIKTYEDARVNGDIPFDQLVNYLNPAKDMSRTALFDILFIYEKEDDTRLDGFTEIENNLGWGKYDYNLLLKEDGKEITYFLTYNRLYYDRPTAERLMKCYFKLMAEVIADPHKSIEKYDYCIDSDKEKLLGAYRTLKKTGYNNLSIPEAIHMQVEKMKDKIAVTDGNKAYSYSGLDSISNRIAMYLVDNGIKEKNVVAVAVEKSSDFIASVIGILKAGCTYLPLDPTLPEDRIQYMIVDSKASCVICKKEDEIAYGGDINIVILEEMIYELEHIPDNGFHKISADNAAYIIYTSGTTGNPKGMVIEHRNVTSLILNNLPLFDFTVDDVWSCTHNCNFDFSIWEIYAPLFTGGKLVLFTKEECRDIDTFRKKLNEQKISILSQTPLAFYALTEYENEQNEHDLLIRNVIFGGEALESAKLQPWKKLYPSVSFINMYGITETTVHVTYKRFSDYEIENGINSIGMPLNGYEVYIVDKGDCLCPIGVTGEMLVGGTGVGRGYLYKDELTAAKFILNTYGEGRLYRSGDYAYRDDNGELHYVGRMDEQIKVRGFRIELGEIAAQLRKINKIEDAVVIAKKDISGTNNINAYIVAKEHLSFPEIKKELSKALPSYMIPTQFAQIEEIPLTQNGKFDKKSLPDIQKNNEIEFVAARNEIESVLVKVFREILGADKVSIYDNFFDLGGDSIKAMRFVAVLRKYGYDLLIKDLMQANTLEDIGESVTINKDLLRYEQGEIKGEISLSPNQKNFFHHLYLEKEYFYQSILLKYEGKLDRQAMQLTIDALQKRHDLLRTIYRNGHQIIRGIEETEENSCGEIYLSNKERIKIKKYCESLMRDTNLEKGPLFKCSIIHLENEEYLFLAAHHLIVDGMSWNILMEDINYIYNQCLNEGDIIFPPKTASYGEWVDVIEKEYSGLKGEQESLYWKKTYTEMPEFGLMRNENNSIKRNSRKLVFDHDHTEKIMYMLTDAFNTKIQIILMAEFIKAINLTMQIDNISIDVEMTGRNDLEEKISLNRSIGWFTTIYPICVPYDNDIRVQIQKIEDAQKAVPDHGIGFNILKNNNQLGEGKPSVLCFNYLGDYEEYIDRRSKWSINTDLDIRDISEKNIMSNLIIADAYVNNEKLTIELTFNAEYIEENMEEYFIEVYQNELLNLIRSTECFHEEERTSNPEFISDETMDEILSFLG